MSDYNYDDYADDDEFEDYVEEYHGAPRGVCPYPVKSIVHAPFKWWCGHKLTRGQNFCDKHSKCVTM